MPSLNQPPMEVSRLFASLSWCSDSKRVVIKEEKLPEEIAEKGVTPEEYVKKTGTKVFFVFKKRLSEAQKEENVETLKRFIAIVENLTEEVSGEVSPEVSGILDGLRQMQAKRQTLTAKKVRKVYRQVMGTELQGIRKIACLHHRGNRLVKDTESTTWKVHNFSFVMLIKYIFSRSFRHAYRAENRAAVQAFRQELVAEWGQERFDRAVKRSKLDLNKKIKRGRSLDARDVKKLVLALADFHQKDLNSSYEKIQNIVREEADLSALSRREVRRLKEEFGGDLSDEELIARLKQEFSEPDSPVEEMNEEAFALLTRVVLCDDREIELAFQGWRDETLNMRHVESWGQRLVYSREHDDKERLQLYQRIWKVHGIADKERVFQSYVEMLSRGIVRMQLEVGHLVPAPARAGQPASGKTEETFNYYRVAKRIATGGGKMAYYLTAANENNTDLPDIIVYRSTTSSPSFKDSWSTIATDMHPFKTAGYHNSELGEEIERELYHGSERDLIVTGHSLGAVHSALSLAKLAARNDMPNRKVTLVTYDGPGLAKTTLDEFNVWVNNASDAAAKRVAIQQYFSKKDFVPAGGFGHLGNGLEMKGRLGGYVSKVLERTEHTHCPEMQLHPHGRPYFQTRLGVDFTEDDVTIEEFDSEKWRHRLEKVRRVVGFIFYPVIVGYIGLKRLFRGFEGDYSGIQQAYRRVFRRNHFRVIE